LRPTRDGDGGISVDMEIAPHAGVLILRGVVAGVLPRWTTIDGQPSTGSVTNGLVDNIR
jgi:hypothetical protein